MYKTVTGKLLNNTGCQASCSMMTQKGETGGGEGISGGKEYI